MSRRNKLGAVSFQHWPNSEGEALSTVALAAHLETGIRGHFCAITCLTGTGLCINATDIWSAAQTRQLFPHTSPYPFYFSGACKPKHFDAQLSSSLSHLRHRNTRSTRQIQVITTNYNRLLIGLSKSKEDKALKLYPNSARDHAVISDTGTPRNLKGWQRKRLYQVPKHRKTWKKDVFHTNEG